MQNRNILYTALTRAKTIVVIVGSLDQTNKMIRNSHSQKRTSSLGDKLRTMQGLVLKKQDKKFEEEIGDI